MCIVFLIFCSRIITNSNYDGLCKDSCQSVLNECKNKENNNEVDVSFLKYTTEIRIGAIGVPTRLVELLHLYYWKSWVCKQQRTSIRSIIRTGSINEDDENMPLQDIDGNQYFIYILLVLIFSNLI